MVDVIVDMSTLNTPSRQRGIGRYVSGLCGALAERSTNQLSIAGLVRHRGSVDGAVDPSLSFGGHDASSPGAIGYGRYKMERRIFLGTLAHRTGASLLHLTDPYGTPIDQRLRRIVTCHDLIPLLFANEYFAGIPGARRLQLARDRARYRTATRIIAISESTKRDLVEHVGVDPERVDVVHHGVDHQRFTDATEPGEAEEVARFVGFRGPFLLYVGAGDARKNLPTLIRAYRAAALEDDVRLVLAGPLSARQRARVARAIASHGVQSSVDVRGYVGDDWVPALYRQCLAFIFPSAYEGFGLPVLEAMACGAPTVTSRCSALSEVAGDAALTIAKPDVEPLAEAMRRVVSDSDLRTSLRARGPTWARGFTWQRCAEQTVQCYLRALS